MKIGVISDTHIQSSHDARYTLTDNIKSNPEALYKLCEPYFKDVDAIIHAGDLTELEVLNVLKRFAEVYAISGNMDSDSVRTVLGEKRILEFGKFRIGVMHGWGAPDGLSDKIREKFSSNTVDCIIFGHSHRPYDKIEDGILMFNPGSPTDTRFAPKRTIGILHIDDTIWGEHFELS